MEPDLEAIDPSTTTCLNWRVPAATVVRVVERALALPHPAFRTENAMLAWWGMRQRDASPTVIRTEPAAT